MAYENNIPDAVNIFVVNAVYKTPYFYVEIDNDFDIDSTLFLTTLCYNIGIFIFRAYFFFIRMPQYSHLRYTHTLHSKTTGRLHNQLTHIREWLGSGVLIDSVVVSIDVINNMMTSTNENIFRITGHLCGEFTGHLWIPRTKASDAELWYFLWYAPE